MEVTGEIAIATLVAMAGRRGVGFASWTDGNHAAKRFYEARGWRVEALRMFDNETADGVCKVAAWKLVKP